ncbi:hypothetical protein [Pseudophaeobacter profundi]|nr:hypothetical protein [Pseudophaeobacter profundi]
MHTASAAFFVALPPQMNGPTLTTAAQPPAIAAQAQAGTGTDWHKGSRNF